MHAVFLALAAFSAISPPQAPPHATAADSCPMVIRVRPDGTFFTFRFQGWRVTSSKTLESDLKGECYNDANPSKVTSVTVEPSPNAPGSRLKFLYDLLARDGWPRERVKNR
jgi:hypothetical protein